MQTKKPSRSDVAEKAGVSTATVSYVFSGRKNATVPEATRQRVLDAAELIGYRPNLLAQSLAHGKTHLVGMVTRLDSFDARIASPARDRLSKAGYQTLLAHSHEHYELDRKDIRVLIDHQVDALLCVSGGWGSPDRPLVTCALEAGIPCVIANDLEASGSIDCVVSDNKEAAKQVVRHLVERGHRRIGFLGAQSYIYTARERLAGYRDALQDAEIAFDSELVYELGYEAEVGYDCTKRLLALDQPPTAIFGANDTIAMGIYHAAIDGGVSVPNDLAIAGFGNEAEAAALRMTTVDQNPDEMARVAVNRLFARMGKPDLPVETFTVACRLIQGRTT
jgi:LacI family transcriptional regulator